MPVYIKLSKGYVAIVDDEDAALADLRWHASPSKKRKDGTRRVYAIRGSGGSTVHMHRQILGFPDSDSDHRNGDTLDSRRENLRAGSRSHNNSNTDKRKGCSSHWKGVTLFKESGKWAGQLSIKGNHIHLGLFRREENAATAYNFAAFEAFGEFARMNTP